MRGVRRDRALDALRPSLEAMINETGDPRIISNLGTALDEALVQAAEAADRAGRSALSAGCARSDRGSNRVNPSRSSRHPIPS